MNYYIADCHFGHNAVLKLDNRPFYDVELMEQAMVQNWNAAVSPKDRVYILGDFCFGKEEDWTRILKKLKGKKVLIRGNHDPKELSADVQRQFEASEDYLQVTDNGWSNEGRRVILSHYPMPLYYHSHNPKFFMFCGHIHNSAENDILERWISELKENVTPDVRGSHSGNLAQIYNVGAMMPWVNYTPRTLDEIIRRRKEWLEEECDCKMADQAYQAHLKNPVTYTHEEVMKVLEDLDCKENMREND